MTGRIGTGSGAVVRGERLYEIKLPTRAAWQQWWHGCRRWWGKGAVRRVTDELEISQERIDEATDSLSTDEEKLAALKQRLCEQARHQHKRFDQEARVQYGWKNRFRTTRVRWFRNDPLGEMLIWPLIENG